MAGGADVQSFRAAVGKARKAGHISIMDAARLQFHARRPELYQEFCAIAVMELSLDPASAGLIDWDNIDLDKLKEILLIILEFVKLFMGLI